MFNDASQFIQGSSATVLSLGATDEIDLTATAIDVNGTLDVSGTTAFGAAVTITETGTGSSAGPFLNLHRDSSSPADSDLIGIIQFQGEDDGSNVTAYGTIAGKIADVTGGTEDGVLLFNVIAAGSSLDALTLSHNEAVFNNGSADYDFRVESDGNTHMLFVDAGNNEVAVGTSNVKATLHVFSSDSSATPNGNANDLFVENSGNAGITIGSGSSSAGQIRFADSESSGRGIVYYDHSSDLMALYTAGAERFRITAASAVFNEDSNDQDFRVESDDNTHMLFLDANDNRVYVGGSTNVNTSALQVTAQAAQSAIVSKVVDNLYSVFQSFNASGDLLTQITGAGVLTHNGSAVITTADNTTTLNLVSTDTDANAGPHLRLSRNATGADSDALGQVEFSGRDDAGNDFIYAQIEAYIVDASNGSEDGYLEIFRGVGGTERVSGMILSSTDTVFNENSADIDFRVESNSNTHALFVNSSSDGVGMGATASPVNAASTEGLFYSIGGSLTVASNTETLQINRNSTGGNNRTNIGLYNNGTLRGTIGTLGGQDGFYFQSGGDVDNLQLQDGVSVFNESSADIDFRVESDGNANMLHVDGGNNAVGIGTTGQSGVLLYVDAPGSTHAAVCRGESTGFAPIIVDNTSGSGTRFLMSFRLSNTEVGSITSTGSTTSYTTSSDARLKENISDADDAGELIDAIQVRKFDWITDGEHQRYGMVAQELNTVAPEAVSAPEDPDEMMGVDYSKLVPMLVKEIQSLRARVAQLESN
jgi:regulator of extracellular matrix RemA (YlzA/DUF370 family)